MIVLIKLLYLLKNKSDVYDIFKLFVNQIENQFNWKIKRFHSDKGIEYNLDVFNNFYNTHGIIHEMWDPNRVLLAR